MSAHDDDLGALWREAETSPLPSTDEIRTKSDAFARRIARRNLREYVASALVVVAFSRMLVRSHDVLERVGAALILVATAYIVLRIRRDGRAAPAPVTATTTAEHLAHLRRELARQRDLLRDVALWYIGPFVPGFALFVAASAQRGGPVTALVTLVGFTVVVAGVVWLNRRGARKLDVAIGALDDQESQATVTPSPPSPG
jgi:hypothetical protein